MTCIVGVAHKGKVYIGGDSAGVGGLDLVQRRDPKVFRNGDFVMGFCGSFRMGQVLAHRFTPPPLKVGQDLYAYMVTDFIDAARMAMKEAGFATVENGRESGGFFLVGIQGRIFNVQSDFQVGESIHDFDACGCGESFALGSLHETGKLDPKVRVTKALQAAETFSAGVRGPFRVEVA